MPVAQDGEWEHIRMTASRLARSLDAEARDYFGKYLDLLQSIETVSRT
jgi:hypothetical protein